MIAMVALLAEGVDRNFMKKTLTSLEEAVALLAEGVDRNYKLSGHRDDEPLSPSSRRAWIEIRILPAI